MPKRQEYNDTSDPNHIEINIQYVLIERYKYITAGNIDKIDKVTIHWKEDFPQSDSKTTIHNMTEPLGLHFAYKNVAIRIWTMSKLIIFILSKSKRNTKTPLLYFIM